MDFGFQAPFVRYGKIHVVKRLSRKGVCETIGAGVAYGLLLIHIWIIHIDLQRVAVCGGLPLDAPLSLFIYQQTVGLARECNLRGRAGHDVEGACLFCGAEGVCQDKADRMGTHCVDSRSQL
jgi:hypothetical protein